MKHRGKIIWLLVAGLLAGLLYFIFHRKPLPDPVYGGKSLSVWFQEARKTPYVYEDAPLTLALRGMGESAVPYLAAELSREESWGSQVYRAWYPALPGFTQRVLPKPAVPDNHQEIAARSLFTIRLPARAAVPALIKIYDRAYDRHFHLPIIFHPNWAMQFTNPPASMLPGGPIPVPENQIREWILLTLSSVGGDSPQVAPLILCAIQEPNNLFRTAFLSYIKDNTNLASAVALAEPTVLLALKDPVPEVRSAAADMLGSIAPQHPEIIPALLQAAADPNQTVRRTAFESLAKTKASVEAVVPTLANSWDDENPEMRRYMGLLLARTAGLGIKGMNSLSNALNSADAPVRAGAAKLLGIYGARASAIVPRLTQLTNEATEPDVNARREAAASLKKINGGGNATP